MHAFTVVHVSTLSRREVIVDHVHRTDLPRRGLDIHVHCIWKQPGWDGILCLFIHVHVCIHENVISGNVCEYD